MGALTLRDSTPFPAGRPDTDAATDTMRHGVLTVTLPKLGVEEVHRVDIE